MKFVSLTRLKESILATYADIEESALTIREHRELKIGDIQDENILTALGSNDVIIDNFDANATSEKIFFKLLPHKIESKYFLKDALYGVIRNENSYQAHITTPSALKKHQMLWKDFGVTPTTVSTKPLALFRFFERYSAKKSLLVIHFSFEITFVIIENRSLEKYFSVPLEADIEKNSALAFNLFNEDKPSVMVTGDYEPFKSLFDESETLEGELQKHALNIGLLLDQTKASPLQLKPPTQSKNSKKFWSVALASAFFLTTCTGYIGYSMLHQRYENILKQTLASFQADKLRFDLNIADAATCEDILDQWNSLLKKARKYPSVQPTVAHLVTWLTKKDIVEKLKIKKLTYRADKNATVELLTAKPIHKNPLITKNSLAVASSVKHTKTAEGYLTSFRIKEVFYE